jgi:beta-lactamase class D
MTQSLRSLISLSDTPYYQCIARCIRRAQHETLVTNLSYGADDRESFQDDALKTHEHLLGQ